MYTYIYTHCIVVYTNGLFRDLVPRSRNKPCVNSLFSNHFQVELVNIMGKEDPGQSLMFPLDV